MAGRIGIGPKDSRVASRKLYKAGKASLIYMKPGPKKLEVDLKVFKGEKMLIASNREMGIFTEGKNWNALMKNIREVIELYFDIPSADVVRIKLLIDAII
jgi:hypothetical protein